MVRPQTVFYLLYARHGVAYRLVGDAEMPCHGNGGKEVGYVAFAHEAGSEVKAPAVGSGDGESCPFGGVRYVLGFVGCFRRYSVAYAAGVAYLSGGNHWEVVVDYHDAVGGNAVGKLELGVAHVFNRFERFEMLRSYGSDNSCGGLHEVAYLLDVAGLLRTHLHDEYFVVWLEHFADCAYNAEGGVVASGSHQGFVAFRQYALEIVLSGGFSVAAGNAYYFQRGHRFEALAGVVVVSFVD